ncbi:MAG: hypothetical protein EZS28_055745, partial [Streblomastix strix]
MLGLELNKFGAHPSTGEGDANVEVETSQFAVLIQRACVAGSAAMIQEDPVAVQRFFLTMHHAARIIAGDAQQRRELALVNGQFKEALGKVVMPTVFMGSYRRIGLKSKYRLKRLYNLLLHKLLQTSQLNHKSTKNKHRSKYSPQIRSNFKYQTAMEANLDMSIPNNKQELPFSRNIKDSGEDLS